MANYLIGDIQGCDAPLARLLQDIDFSPSRDRLYLLGDLVNRGPDSAAVLRRLMALGEAVRCVLGNHDLHLLAVAHGVRKQRADDTLDGVLRARDCAAMVDWLRRQPMALFDRQWLMVHAGVLLHLHGTQPAQWSDDLQGAARLRVIVNALTRMRYCSAQGVMEVSSKEGKGGAPEGYLPWFEVPQRATASVNVAFGHWSTLGLLQRDGLLALDTGCVWGGCLSAVRLGADDRCAELIQVKCPQARKPG